MNEHRQKAALDSIIAAFRRFDQTFLVMNAKRKCLDLDEVLEQASKTQFKRFTRGMFEQYWHVVPEFYHPTWCFDSNPKAGRPKAFIFLKPTKETESTKVQNRVDTFISNFAEVVKSLGIEPGTVPNLYEVLPRRSLPENPRTSLSHEYKSKQLELVQSRCSKEIFKWLRRRGETEEKQLHIFRNATMWYKEVCGEPMGFSFDKYWQRKTNGERFKRRPKHRKVRRKVINVDNLWRSSTEEDGEGIFELPINPREVQEDIADTALEVICELKALKKIDPDVKPTVIPHFLFPNEKRLPGSDIDIHNLLQRSHVEDCFASFCI